MPYSDRIVGSLSVQAFLKKDGFKEAYEKLTKKTGATKLLGRLADKYLEFIHNRHRQEGYNTWRKLHPVTIKKRRNSRERVPNYSTKVLIDTGQLLDVSAPGGRGQVRKLDVSTMTARAGVDGTTVYHDPRTGHNKRRVKPRTGNSDRRVTLADLVHWHSSGERGVSKRTIFVEPNGGVQKSMQKTCENWIEELINGIR